MHATATALPVQGQAPYRRLHVRRVSAPRGATRPPARRRMRPRLTAPAPRTPDHGDRSEAPCSPRRLTCSSTLRSAARRIFCFNVQALSSGQQFVRAEALDISHSAQASPPPLRQYLDPHGNRFVRDGADAGQLRLHYRASVELRTGATPQHLAESPIAALPDEVLHYLMPSRARLTGWRRPRSRCSASSRPAGSACRRSRRGFTREH